MGIHDLHLLLLSRGAGRIVLVQRRKDLCRDFIQNPGQIALRLPQIDRQMVRTRRVQRPEMPDRRAPPHSRAKADRLGRGIGIGQQIEVEGTDESAPPFGGLRPIPAFCCIRPMPPG